MKFPIVEKQANTDILNLRARFKTKEDLIE